MVTAAPAQGAGGQILVRTSHFHDLDGVRGILAVTVMFYHYGINALLAKLSGGLIADSPWGAMVDFFFILSGFVLTRAWLMRSRSLPRVLVERIFRLMPVHLALMVLFAPLYILTRPNTLLSLLADWTATSVYFDTARWNGPSWSINIELYVPILLAASLPFFRNVPHYVALGALIVLLAIDSWLALGLAQGQESFVARGVAGLSIGVLLYRCSQKWSPPAFGARWILPLLTLAMLAIVAMSGRAPLLALISPPLMAIAVWWGSRSHSVLGRGIFAFVGMLSYTVYMVHQNLKSLAFYILDVDDFGGSIGIKVVLIALVFVFAWLLHRYVELPGMKLGKRVSQRMAAGAA